MVLKGYTWITLPDGTRHYAKKLAECLYQLLSGEVLVLQQYEADHPVEVVHDRKLN